MGTMNNSTLLLAIVIVLAIVVAIALIVRAQRSARLKNRFGPEYGRTVEQTGSAAKAEAKLEQLTRRVEGFKIVPIGPQARADYVSAWKRVQARFVDDPKTALVEADRVIQRIMADRGYPVTDFEQRAADLSVHHPLIVDNYRAGHAISLRHSQGQATTEDLRQAMLHYRNLFDELVGETSQSVAAPAARVGR